MILVKKRNDVIRPSIFDDFFMPYNLNRVAGSRSAQDVPAANVKETDENFHVELRVPGRKKEDFVIELKDDTLSITSEMTTAHEETGEEGKYTRQEFYSSSFRRAFTLPETVDPESISANYESGILKIVLPKREPVKNSKRLISIS